MDPADNSKRTEYGPWESSSVKPGLVMFMRKRRQGEIPVYENRLKNYVELRRKRSKAAASRRRSELGRDVTRPVVEKSATQAQNDSGNTDDALEQERRSYILRSRGDNGNSQQADKCRCRRSGKKNKCPCNRRRRSARRRGCGSKRRRSGRSRCGSKRRSGRARRGKSCKRKGSKRGRKGRKGCGC